MINWQYIKGLNEDSTAADKKSLYTFFDFQYKNDNNLKHHDNLPHIWINTTNEKGTQIDNDAGAIITQLALNQSIDTAFKFHSTLAVVSSTDVLPPEADNSFYCTRPMKVHGTSDFYGGFVIHDNWLTIDIGETSGTTPTINCINKASQLNIDFGSSCKAYFTKDGDFHTNNKCEAQYFNATSDRRAKDNLKILNFKALDLINHTNLYSFIYKDTNTPSIGIIAQDVQDVNIDGFKLVDNENATGQDMDYMSVHESKLVYILWQAIKEQQKEIEELKKRLN